MNQSFIGNPTQAAARFATEHLTIVSEPVAGMIGLLLFFALIIGCLATLTCIVQKVLKH